MEVTTVSPSPASPTEGDDLCETDVTNVAIHSVTLLVCLCGLVGNGAVLCLLSVKGRNLFLFLLAFSDVFFLLFTVPAAFVFLVEDMSCSPIMSLLYLSLIFQLSWVTSIWTLMAMLYSGGMADMCTFCIVNMLFFLYRHSDIPQRLLWLMICFNVFTFFALFTVIPAVTNLCPSYEQEHCQAAVISMYTIILFLFAAPVVISSTMKFFKAMRGSSEQQPKRRNIIVFLIVLLIILLNLCHLLQQLGYIVVSSEVLLLFNCIYSSIKPFLFFLAGGFQRPCSLESLRLSLQRVFDDRNDVAARFLDDVFDTLL